MVPLLLFWIGQNGQKASDAMVRQELSLEGQSIRRSTADADNHQAIQLLADLGAQSGPDQLTQRRAMAQAVLEYVNQSRLYHPSTVVAISYLGRECDQETYEKLHEAVERALLVVPKSVDPANKEDTESDKKDRTDYDAKLFVAAEKTRATICIAGHAVLNVSQLPKTSYFRQYLEVGCGDTSSSSLNIPLSSEDQTNYQVAEVKAYFESISNLKAETQQSSVNADHESVTVTYSITGLDRQFLGNCPGGGHATLVIASQLQPKANTAQQPQSTAPPQK